MRPAFRPVAPTTSVVDVWTAAIWAAIVRLLFRHTPQLLGNFPAELVTHTSQHRDLAQFAGKDVTIVGRGQSGLETAALLHERGTNVRILVRAANVEWNSDPNAARSLITRLRRPVQTAGATVRFETDHIIAATGYKVDLRRLAFLDQALQSEIKAFDGSPKLNAAFESSVPGLHFVGVASAQSFGPVMRFVYGTKHAAAILTRHMRSTPRLRPSKISTGRTTAVRASGIARVSR